MSTNQLTWDNLDDFISSLPKDATGRFLPNPRANEKLVLSTDRDKWPGGIENYVELNKGIAKEMYNAVKKAFSEWGTQLLSEVQEQVVNTLVSDGSIIMSKDWFDNIGVTGDETCAEIDTLAGKLTLRSTPHNAAKESVVKIKGLTFYCEAFPTEEYIKSEKAMFPEFKSGPMSNEMTEATTAVMVAHHVSQLIEETPEDVPLGEAVAGAYDSLGKETGLSDAFFPTIVVSKVTEDTRLVDVVGEAQKSLENTTGIGEELFPTIAEGEVKDPTLLERAKANIADLDVKEAEKEFENQVEGMRKAKELKDSGMTAVINSPLTNPNMTKEQLKEWSDRNVENAKSIIARMDAALEEGGRVNVADKFLMNCKADLNQLIPFKYETPWTLYLGSCNNHWMPAEMRLENSKSAYTATNDSNKKLMALGHFTFLSRCNLFPESVLLNLYRMMTNPECRQYLLRQGQESVTVKHAWMEVNETVDVVNTLIDGDLPSKALGRQVDIVFRERHKAVMKAVNFAHDYSSETTETKDLAEFLKSFIVLYTYVNWVMPLVAHYQISTALELHEICPEMREMFARLNKDGSNQFQFAQFFVEGVIQENPAIVTKEWITDVRSTLQQLFNFDISLAAMHPCSEHAIVEVGYIGHHYIDTMMLCIDPQHTRWAIQKDSQRGQMFVNNINNAKTDMHQSSGLGGFVW